MFLRNGHGKLFLKKKNVSRRILKPKKSKNLSTAKFHNVKFGTGYFVCHGLLFLTWSRVYKKMSRGKKNTGEWEVFSGFWWGGIFVAPPILIVGFCEFLEFLKVISYSLTRVKYLNVPGR